MGEETDTDLYLPMRPKLERGSILVIHTHEGEPIAEFIKNNLERFNDQFHINVSTCDVNEVESRNLAYQVTILLITKETISHLESITDSPCPSLQFHTNTTCAFLVHESVCIEDEHVKTVLENKIPNFSVWKPLKIQSVRSTVIDIVNLLDQTEESFPPTLQYHLEPNYIVTVSGGISTIFIIENVRYTLKHIKTNLMYIKKHREGAIIKLYLYGSTVHRATGCHFVLFEHTCVLFLF